MVEQLTLGLVVSAALADSINPCVFGVLIFLLAYMTKVFRYKSKMLISGLLYVLAVYTTYFFIGLGIFSLAHTARYAKSFYWISASIAILAGLFEIKDFFWYNKGFSLQIFPGGAKLIKKFSDALVHMEKRRPSLSMILAFILGILVVFLELPCTGAPYLAILGLIASGDYSAAVPLLLLYNIIFILPLIIIIILVYFGYSSRTLEKWRKENRGLMRLFIGLFLLALGLYMLWAVT